MAVFDILNPPTQPDSDLDSDLSLETVFPVEGGDVGIAPGDFVDVNPMYMSPDPVWGYSYQVCNLYPESTAIGILIMTDMINQQYTETTLDAIIVTNNYRRVPKS